MGVMQAIGKQMITGRRSSNLELYRIIVMLLIMSHHYVVHSGLLDVIRDSPLSMTSCIMVLFGSWGKTGIDCFVMITGWFMCKSKFTVKKLVKLYCNVAFYSVVIYTLFCAFGGEGFSLVSFVAKFFPINGISNNFISAFFVFYMLIPFLNILVQGLTKRMHAILALLLLSVYSLLPLNPFFEIEYNYVSWFLTIYIVISYIRFYKFPLSIGHSCWGWMTLGFILIASSSVLILLVAYKYQWKAGFGPYWFIRDCNQFLAFAIGLSSFMYFKDLKINYSRLINVIGATTFGVLLIHDNSIMRHLLWKDIFNAADNFKESTLFTFGYAFITVISVFIVCSGIDWVRGKLLDSSVAKLGDCIENWYSDKYVDA